MKRVIRSGSQLTSNVALPLLPLPTLETTHPCGIPLLTNGGDETRHPPSSGLVRTLSKGVAGKIALHLVAITLSTRSLGTAIIPPYEGCLT